MEKANLNTILLAVTLGVMSWVGYTTYESGKAIATIAEKVSYSDREIVDMRLRLSKVEFDVVRMKSKLNLPD